MKYPWYGVTSDFFGGIHWAPRHEGCFDTPEEAKAKFDSVELDDYHKGVFVYEFYEDSCKTIFQKERKLTHPTPERMGRAKYIPLKDCQRLLKEGKL